MELAEWTGESTIAGVALFQPNLGTGKQCDLLVIAPGGVVVIEVKGLCKGLSGQKPQGLISVPKNDVWRCDGEPLRLYLKRDHFRPHGEGINPLNQTTGYCTKIGTSLRERLGVTDLWVKGLVLLVYAGCPRADPIRVQDGVHHVDNDARGPLLSVTTLVPDRDSEALQDYFHQLNNEPVLDAPTARAILNALEADGLSLEELVDEGFPERVEPKASSPSRELAVVEPPASAPPAAIRSSPATPVNEGEVQPQLRATTLAAQRMLHDNRVREQQHPVPRPTAPAAPVTRGTPSQYVRPGPAIKVVRPPRWSAPRKHRRRRWAVPVLICCLVLFGLYVGAKEYNATSARYDTARAATRTTPTRAIRFMTPSRNIICTADSSGGGSLRCDIDTVYYGTPPIPADCKETPNWGHVVVLEAAAAHLECPMTRRTASTQRPADTVAYGHRVTGGGAVCTSSSAHLECRRGAHGFQLSRARYRVW